MYLSDSLPEPDLALKCDQHVASSFLIKYMAYQRYRFEKQLYYLRLCISKPIYQ